MRVLLIFAAATTVAAASNGFESAKDSMSTAVLFLASALAAAALIRPVVELWDRFVTRPRTEAQQRYAEALANLERKLEQYRSDTSRSIHLIHQRIDVLPTEIIKILKNLPNP